MSGSLADAMAHHAPTAPVEIGHDCWLGHAVVVLAGAKVGTGAAVGAGAIVTRDIPDYAIAVGNPARVVGQRFSDDIAALLLESRWWDLDDGIESFRFAFSLDLRDDDQGPDALAEAIAATRHRLPARQA